MIYFDFAWLKQWWPEVTRREPHRGPGNIGKTRSERRALEKARLGLKKKDRLPVGHRVT